MEGGERLEGFEDHPRIRGEHLDLLGTAYSWPGIIPAYAGSTAWTWLIGEQSQDHPRIRGEHFQTVVPFLSMAGIIPAYAGST